MSQFIDCNHIPATGNIVIDAAHFRIAGEVNELFEKWQAGEAASELLSCLSAMLREIEQHFHLENLIARGAGIPDWERHAFEHKSFIDRFRAIEKDFAAGNHDSLMSFFDTVSSLIYEHEILEDYALRSFLADTSAIGSGNGYIEWQDDLVTGIGEIDEDHRRMVVLLNDFYHAVEDGADNETLQEKLRGLNQVTREHFRLEEALMDQRKFEGLELHRAAHRALTAALEEMIQLTARGGPLCSRPLLLRNLRHWFIDHVVHMDKVAHRDKDDTPGTDSSRKH